jgi:iron complex transport system ATP-binding protein
VSDPCVLEIVDLSVRRGTRDVVRSISLSVHPSERVALVGPNAAGKSTLLSTAAGLLPRAAGEVRLDGRSLATLSGREIARAVALVVALQEGAPKLSVRESTELGRYPHTGPFNALSSHDQEAVSRAIAESGLQDLAERSLGSLSAGERQRALVARALAQEPKLLLLDEPSAHLDIGHGLDLFALLTTIAARGVAIVAVIHDLVAAAQWATRMIVLHEGQVIDDGTPGAVMKGEPLGRAFGVSASEARSASDERATTWRFERRPPG